MTQARNESLLQVRAVEDSLAHYSIGGDNLQSSLDALHRLLATDKLFLFSLAKAPSGQDVAVTRTVTVAYPADRWRSVFDEFLRGRGVAWAGYDSLRPELPHRDQVLRTDEVITLTEGRSREAKELLYERLGIGGQDTMRVLVCDGPDMLAWIGCVQPERTTERQRSLLSRVVPAFRKRLLFERLISGATLASTALGASLEEHAVAVWVLGADGTVAHANAAGRARFDADPPAMRSALAGCVAGASSSPLKAIALRDRSGSAGHIIVEPPDAASSISAAEQAARRLGLTSAQARVLRCVARGISNAKTATELGVAERTIEAHVTAILRKAQVPSRSALIVRILSEASKS